MKGRVVIVTGGGRGLGRAIAVGLAKAGSIVVVAGRTEGDLDETVRQIQAADGQAYAFVFDAADEASCEKLVQFTTARCGRLDSMVVNHGITFHGYALQTTGEDFSRVLDANLTGAFLSAKAAGKEMAKQQSGSIVFVSSIASHSAYERLTAYCCSKAGVNQLCKQLALEWARHGIRVNAIGPGLMDNYMRGTEAKEGGNDFKAVAGERVPLGRVGRAEELVGPVIFLAGDASSYITGAYIPVDGGSTIV